MHKNLAIAFVFLVGGVVHGLEKSEGVNPHVYAYFSENKIDGKSELVVSTNAKLTSVQVRYESNTRDDAWGILKAYQSEKDYFPYGTQEYGMERAAGEVYIVRALQADGSRFTDKLTVQKDGEIVVEGLSEETALEVSNKDGGPTLALLNSHRQRRGLRPLLHDPVMHARAFERAAAMARHGSMSHGIHGYGTCRSWQGVGGTNEGISMGGGPHTACYAMSSGFTYVGTACVRGYCCNIYR